MVALAFALLLVLRVFLLSQSVDKEILDVLPKIKEAKNIVGMMDRDTLTFDVALQRTEDEVQQCLAVDLLVAWCWDSGRFAHPPHD